LPVVLQDASAIVVHQAEVSLCASVRALGQRTQEPHRLGVVAALICSLAVLKRPCHRYAEQSERENAARKESSDVLLS